MRPIRLVRLFPALAAVVIAASSVVQAQEGAEPTETEAAEASFVIGVEDVLRIVTWGEPELTVTVTVRPDGRITLPLINELKVAGQTPARVREAIVEKMKGFIRDPNVTVVVEQINHFRVYFLGEINTQGPLQFNRPVRLLQAISAAGGLTEFSNKRITVIRDEYGVEKRIEIDYKKLWAGDTGQENIYLKPGDTVLVK